MAKKICFIGAPGSGKSFLNNVVFIELKKLHLNVEIVHENARYDIQQNGPMENIFEQYRILSKQKEIEDNIPDVCDYVCVDSGTVSPYFYTCLYADYNNQRHRLALKDCYGYLIDDLANKRYDEIFILPVTKTYEINKNILSDGTRWQTPEEVHILNNNMIAFFRTHKFNNVHIVDVDLDDRLSYVLNIILDKEV